MPNLALSTKISWMFVLLRLCCLQPKLPSHARQLALLLVMTRMDVLLLWIFLL